MGAFFEFIFGNLAFLIVVIGGILSFLNRDKKDQNPTPKKKMSFPPLEDFNPFEPPQVELEQPKPVIKAKRIQFEAPRELDIESNLINEKTTKIEEVPLKMIDYSKPVPDVKKKDPELQINLQQINKKRVLEGIVWGEILGSPRAKKKHSYSHMKRG